MRRFAARIAAENGGPQHPVVLTATLAGRSVDGGTAFAGELGEVGNFCESHGAIKGMAGRYLISERERTNDRLFSVVTHQKK